MNILYINLGNNVRYSYDKPLGRILGWMGEGNSVYLLAPEIDLQTLSDESTKVGKNSLKIIYLPFTKWETATAIGIVLSYMWRILVSPLVLFYAWPKLDFVYSNSAFFVDTVPAILLKLFRKTNKWVVMIDSVVPKPNLRQGSRFINHITYYESLLITLLAKRFAYLVFTVNPELKSILIKRGIPEGKIILSKNGIRLDKIRNAKKETEPHYLAVYQGRITANKGVYDLLKLWKSLIKKYPSGKLAIMGSALKENLDRLNKEIKAYRLENNVEYLGFTAAPQKYEIMKNSKLFLYLSKVNADESWGISLMEALACGLPSIAYDLPVYKHVYITKAVITVPLSKLPEVKRNVYKILNNKDYRLSLSNEAKKYSQKYDWNAIALEDLEAIKIHHDFR